MAKLTRKLWVGIGAATIAGASMTGSVVAQHGSHKQNAGPQSPAPDGPATRTPAEGGEAYLTDGGPKDTRIRFYRDIELMRGHLLVGRQLIELDLWDEALPHFLHPTEELYGLMEKYIKLHNIPPFDRDLQALAQTVKAKRKGAYEQAQKVVDRRLDAALAVAKKFMTPVRIFTVRAAIEVLHVAQSEYEASVQDGKFVKPVEYQDSRGFVLQAERMFERSAAELARIDKDALARIRATLAKLKTAWPAPMSPDKPVLDAGTISALISDIELHISRY
ncbi:MAG: hypothetical protein HC868_11185 [Sphingomonadales bacterium]|nr:hypothetical protein [Sphingomonadales bacterium]